jgi:hypothetical protein
MSDFPTLEEAKATASEACRKLQSIEAMVREEKRKAEAAIDERFREIVKGARSEMARAERALKGAMDRQPDHPLTGRRVYKMEHVSDRWSRREERVEGVVQTRRSDTEFPGNTASYSLPDLGAGFVRRLNKDGKPGLRFDKLHVGPESWKWHLVEDESDHSSAA